MGNFPRKTFPFSIIFSNKQNHSTLFPNGRFHIVIIFMTLRANLYIVESRSLRWGSLWMLKPSSPFTQTNERINAERENVGHEAREKNLFKINLYFIQTAICILASSLPLHSLLQPTTTILSGASKEWVKQTFILYSLFCFNLPKGIIISINWSFSIETHKNNRKGLKLEFFSNLNLFLKLIYDKK